MTLENAELKGYIHLTATARIHNKNINYMYFMNASIF